LRVAAFLLPAAIGGLVQLTETVLCQGVALKPYVVFSL
jgi:hypothetical protein